MSVKGKTVILGVTGGIAAYKSCIVCSQLAQKGADVHVIMTSSARQFVQPLTFQSLSRNRVHTDTFDEADPSVIAHIDLADRADLVVVAPATANIMAKLAHGLADDMLTTTLMATRAPIWLAPAMNVHMYAHPALQDNMQLLARRGVRMLEPGEGSLACGYTGKGRMAEPEQIIAEVERFFQGNHWWQGKKVVITAGPTQEQIDAVRYISNYSSGKMGYALAEAAVRFGAKVVLVTGPVSLDAPAGAEVVRVKSAEEMRTHVLAHFGDADVVIKAAAVADYRPEVTHRQKMKKEAPSLQLNLVRTPDILLELGQRKQDQLLIGFAAETDRVETYARQKLQRKQLDYVVANDVSVDGIGFGADENAVSVFAKDGQVYNWPATNKQELAVRLLSRIAAHQAGEPLDDVHDRFEGAYDQPSDTHDQPGDTHERSDDADE